MLTDNRPHRAMLLKAALVATYLAPIVWAQYDIPPWVPIYPGAKISDVQFQPDRVQSHLVFHITTPDSCGRVSKFYEDRLTTAGFSIVKGSADQNDRSCILGLQSHDGSHQRNLNLSGGRFGRGTRFEVEVMELVNSGRTAIPGNSSNVASWVPQYPQGGTPRNLASHQDGGEIFTTFTIQTRTNARTLLGWYQDRLRQAGFEVSMDVAGTNGALRSNTRDGARSLKIEVSATGGQNVALFEVRDTPQSGTHGGSTRR